MAVGPISFQNRSDEGNIMKSLSVFVTLLLLVTASQLAARLRKTGTLPAQNFAATERSTLNQSLKP
jgi:hypothetical protein